MVLVLVLALETALVDDIGGLLATLRDDVVGAKVVGGGSQFRQQKHREPRHASGAGGAGVDAVGLGCGRISLNVVVVVAKELVVVVVAAVYVVIGMRSSREDRFATAHN